jgi:hypothetical protein
VLPCSSWLSRCGVRSRIAARATQSADHLLGGVGSRRNDVRRRDIDDAHITLDLIFGLLRLGSGSAGRLDQTEITSPECFGMKLRRSIAPLRRARVGSPSQARVSDQHSRQQPAEGRRGISQRDTGVIVAGELHHNRMAPERDLRMRLNGPPDLPVADQRRQRRWRRTGRARATADQPSDHRCDAGTPERQAPQRRDKRRQLLERREVSQRRYSVRGRDVALTHQPGGGRQPSLIGPRMLAIASGPRSHWVIARRRELRRRIDKPAGCASPKSGNNGPAPCRASGSTMLSG